MSKPLVPSLTLEEAPGADFVDRLSRLVERSLHPSGWSFCCMSEGERCDLSGEELAAPDGFLPMLMHRASLVMNEIYGRPPPMAYTPAPGSLCVVTPTPIGPCPSLATWALFIHYSLDNWSQKHRLGSPDAVIPLDVWLKEWDAALKNRTIQVVPGPVPFGPPSSRSPDGMQGNPK